ncbi:MAG: hypothetical protein AB8G95_26835 [Anaerolineae bacterium]
MTQMTIPTISAVNITKSIAYGQTNEQIISIPCISIKLSNGSVFKGDGILNGSDSIHASHYSALADALTQTLKGKPAADFLPLCEQLSQVRFQIEEWRYPEPELATAEQSLKKNRRDMLSILGVVEPKQPEKVLTPVDYPLPAAIIRGTTAALLRAAADAQEQTLLGFVQTLLKSPSDLEKPLQLGLDVSLASHQPLLNHASALCYSVPAASGAESLGKSSEKFQKYLRQLNSWIDESWPHKDAADRPLLFIDLNGSIHRLNGNVSGKTLGSLFGFSTTGNQERMIFANSIIGDTPLKTVNDTKLLQSLVKSRKLKLKLAAANDTNSIAKVGLWLRECKPELIVLKDAEIPNLGEWVKIIQTIHSNQTPLILIGESVGNSRSWELIHTIATVAAPEFYIPAGGKQGFMEVVNR